MITPSEIVKNVYREHIEKFGEPAQSFRYDNQSSDNGISYPQFVDVMIWVPDEDVNMTTFATIGMSDKAMKGVDYRVELHLAVEGALDENTTGKLTIFLANLSLYPFMNSTYFDWWHTVPNAGNIPGFPSTQSLLLHPAFVKDGWDLICTDLGHIKIINIVPITKEEQQMSKEKGINALLDYLDENEISYFARR